MSRSLAEELSVSRRPIRSRGSTPAGALLVIEKENDLAHHQTGHNSGVLHSGIYYKPGSLKAINCRAGKKAMEEFCAAEGIAYEICGKVIVAVDERDLPALERIYRAGPGQWRELHEDRQGPPCRARASCRRCQCDPRSRGRHRQLSRRFATPGRARARTRRRSADGDPRHRHEQEWRGRRRRDHAGDVKARQAVNCAGLQCDRVTAMSGETPGAKIVPFRGEYFELKPEAHHFCKNLIYPVPDPNFPFLGVHFTRMIDGSVECGPNAVLAFAREGYKKTDLNIADLAESLTYPGIPANGPQILADGHGRDVAVGEQGRFRQGASAPLAGDPRRAPRAAPAGVRAQAVTRDGEPRRRLPDPGNRPGYQRRQCTIAGGDRVAQYR